MQLHTTARIEHDQSLLSVVKAATEVIVEELGRTEEIGIAWDVTEHGLSVWVVDRLEQLPEIKLDALAVDDIAGLRQKIRRLRERFPRVGA